MVKKGILKRTGCILISTSIILTGWTFFGSSVSEADYASGTYSTDGGTISDGTLDGYQGELKYVTSTGDLTVSSYGLDGYTSLETVIVNDHKLTLGSGSFMGDTELTAVRCGTMAGADATTFSNCDNVSIRITNQTLGSGYYTYPETNGALYNGHELIYVPGHITSLTVYPGTTSVAAGAFNDSNVESLYFYNRDADKITSFGAQTGWPSNTMVCYCYGGSTEISAAEVADFFARRCENAGSNKVRYDQSDTEITVTITEVYGDTSKTIDYTDKSPGDVIRPSEYDGYACSDYYTVTDEATQAHTFNYTAVTGIEVTIVEECTEEGYEFSETLPVIKDKAEGDVITATTRDGYTCEENTYTVTGDTTQTHTFTYTKSETPPDPGPTPTPTPTPTPSPSGGGGGGSSSGGSSSGGGSSASTTTVPAVANVTEAAKNNQCYKITEGAGQIITQGSVPSRIVCDGPIEKLAYISVDGPIDPKNYTVQSGSTILNLSKDFVSTLAVGDHVVIFQYTDGYACTGLRITPAGTTAKTTTTVTYRVNSDGSISSGHTRDATPKTADGFDNRYLLCMAIFLLGAGAILLGRQRKLEAMLASKRDE